MQGGLIGPPDRDPELIDLRLRASHIWAADKSGRNTTLIIAGITGGVVAVGIIASQAIRGIPLWLLSILIAPVFFVVLSVVARWCMKRNAPGIAELFLREGRCPSCSYSLAGAVAEADGRMVCPECGSAWLASRIRLSTDAPAALQTYKQQVFKPPMRDRFLSTGKRLLIVRDARGRAVYVTNPRLRGLDQAATDRLGHAKIQSIRRALRGRWRSVLVGLFMLLPLIAVLRLMLVRAPGGANAATFFSFAAFLFWGFAAFSILLVVWSFVIGDGAIGPQRAADVHVAEGVCPQCLELIEGRAADDYGIVDCVGCGAAWKRPAVS